MNLPKPAKQTLYSLSFSLVACPTPHPLCPYVFWIIVLGEASNGGVTPTLDCFSLLTPYSHCKWSVPIQWHYPCPEDLCSLCSGHGQRKGNANEAAASTALVPIRPFIFRLSSSRITTQLIRRLLRDRMAVSCHDVSGFHHNGQRQAVSILTEKLWSAASYLESHIRFKYSTIYQSEEGLRGCWYFVSGTSLSFAALMRSASEQLPCICVCYAYLSQAAHRSSCLLSSYGWC